jgi:hypothetical protein
MLNKPVCVLERSRLRDNTNLYTSTTNTVINPVNSPARQETAAHCLQVSSPAREMHLRGNIRGHAELDVKLWRNMACSHTDEGKQKTQDAQGWLEAFERFAIKIRAGGAKTDQATLTHSSMLMQPGSMPASICNQPPFQRSSRSKGPFFETLA